MPSPVVIWKGLDKSDRYMVISSIVAPMVIWWAYTGRHKYGTKGLTRNG